MSLAAETAKLLQDLGVAKPGGEHAVHTPITGEEIARVATRTDIAAAVTKHLS